MIFDCGFHSFQRSRTGERREFATGAPNKSLGNEGDLMAHVSVLGAAELAKLAADLRRVDGGRVVLNTMRREIPTAGKPIKAAATTHILATLPKGGGLNAWVAAAPVQISLRFDF
jgi:hypothetical protein